MERAPEASLSTVMVREPGGRADGVSDTWPAAWPTPGPAGGLAPCAASPAASTTIVNGTLKFKMLPFRSRIAVCGLPISFFHHQARNADSAGRGVGLRHGHAASRG